MYFPPGFDLLRSIELARLVVQAYDQLDSLQKGFPWTPKGGYALLKEFLQESAVDFSGPLHTQFDSEMRRLRKSKDRKVVIDPIGFVARKGSCAYVVFRGTATVTEWVRNLNIKLTDYLEGDYGKVHEGFLETYMIVRQGLLETLSGLDPRMKVFVVGHSLGAALATLAQPDIAANTRFTSPTIYTFGSPRVGDRLFSRSFNDMFARRSFRIVNTSDVIVSLPLPVPILGIIGGYFSHVDTPVDFNSQNDDSEQNHKMETYLSALLAARRGNGIWKTVLRWPLTAR